MTRVLVIQLCRLGDILQTTPMLRGLRREHPQAELTVVVLDGFSHAPVPRHLYDRLVALPFGQVSGALAGRPDGWRDAEATLRRFVGELSNAPYDLVLNLTGSPLANLLCAVVPSHEVRGGTIAADRTRVVRGEWMTYFWASLLARSTGSVNLVDLFQWTAGVGIDGRGLEIDVPPEAHASVEAWLSKEGLAGVPLVALQLGASDQRKRWPAERFAEMANLLPDSVGPFVFVGARSEQAMVRRALDRISRPAVSAVGETSVPELAALLQRSRLLVTNDTGTMHVAAAVGTPIVDLSTGPVFVHETGPYGIGHIALEPVSACFPCAAGAVCHHLACRDDLRPADVASVAMFALGEAPCPAPPRVRILQARRRASGRIEYQPIWQPVEDPVGALRSALADMWEATLAVPPPVAGVTSERIETVEAQGELSGGLARLERIARQAQHGAGRIGRATTGERRRLAGEMGHAMEAAVTLAGLDPLVQPIVAFLRTEIESCASSDVERLASAYAAAWNGAARRARHLAAGLAKRKAA